MKAEPKIVAEAISVLNRFADAYSRRDKEGLLSLFVSDPDVLLLGTGPDEKCMGLKEIEAQAERDWAQSESLVLDFTWHSVSAKGAVAWVATEGVARIVTVEGEVTLPLRWTVVLEERDGRWLIAQSHASLPISGKLS